MKKLPKGYPAYAPPMKGKTLKDWMALTKHKPADPLEKVIEQKVCDHAKTLGCLVYKFTSPSRRSVPDRLFIMPGGKGVFFIEFKRRGAKPTPSQEVEIAKIHEQGIAVFVVDSVETGKHVIDTCFLCTPQKAFLAFSTKGIASNNLDDY